MDLLLRHIRDTAERRKLAGAPLREFVESFLKDRRGPDSSGSWHTFRIESQGAAVDVLDACYRALLLDQFQCGKGADYRRQQVYGYLEKTYPRNAAWLASIDGLLRATLELRFEVRVRLDDRGAIALELSHPLETWVQEFRACLEKELGRRATAQIPAAIRNPVLGPGEEAPETSFTGVLRDYSGCATLAEVASLVKTAGDDKVLPLGVYAFDPRPELAAGNPLLCLGSFKTGAPMMYNGALIVAPQNSGKTELIVRWALAANRAGYNILLVDVKGSLFERLRAEGLAGRVFHFTTDPEPAAASHRLNLLEGLDPWTPKGRREIDQLVEALLPSEGFDEGEDQLFRLIRVKWLAAFLNLIKMRELTYSGAPSMVADLGQVYEMATDERFLARVVQDLRNGAEALKQQNRQMPGPGVDYWLNELSLLIAPDAPWYSGGQREPRYTYQTLTIGIATSLRPFSKIGTLHGRTTGKGDFTLKALDSAEQTTIVLAAREQDMEDSRTTVSVAVKRLEQILFDRRKVKNPARHILLLLDETRRIRAFRAGEYITFARDAKAGCVLVYQSITQIKSEAEIVEILENVGVQIYLGSLVGETAQRFIRMLPRRHRLSLSRSRSAGSDGVSESLQMSQSEVDYFTTNELYRLPAGEYPALVYIKDYGAGRPILVDMSRGRLEEAQRRIDRTSPANPRTF